jgi:hypothetical protein
VSWKEEKSRDFLFYGNQRTPLCTDWRVRNTDSWQEVTPVTIVGAEIWLEFFKSQKPSQQTDLTLGVPHRTGNMISIEESPKPLRMMMGNVPGFPTSKPSPATESKPRSKPTSSFESLSNDELEAHMGVFRYGVFDLTDAVRPSYDLQVVPKQGFRRDSYVDPKTNTEVPVVMAAASKERLFDLFLDLIDCLGDEVDVVLETSHFGDSGEHEDLYREHIDVPVLKSLLCDYENLLLNDGCTGIAVLNSRKQQEIQFDEHKMLLCYGMPLDRFEKVLIAHDVYPDESIRFLSEAEHVHCSSDVFSREFQKLTTSLGIDDGFCD